MIIKTNSFRTGTMPINEFLSHISPEKLARMRQVLIQRTRYVTVVTEEIHYAHNASAVMRSAECFGVQDLYAIQGRNSFSAYTGIARGSYKWMSLHHYKSAVDCYANLKEKGYRIVATSPHATAKLPRDVSLDSKIALVFGNESWGLSKAAIDMADEFIAIPMVGFTESLNVSVCVSICLYDLMQKLRTSSVAWQLSESEQQEIFEDWLQNNFFR